MAYSSADFPFYLRRSTFSHYCPALRHACHWHLEFLYTEKGHIDYQVDSAVYHLREGDGIFVNARRMHNGFSPDGTDCTFVTILFHPLLFSQSASMVDRCIRPLTGNTAFPACVLTRESEDWGRTLALLHEIADNYDAQPAFVELLLTSLLCRVLYELNCHMPMQGADPIRGKHDLTVLHAIMQYAQEHMQDHLTLQTLAESGHVCQSHCSHLFRRLLNRPLWSM